MWCTDGILLNFAMNTMLQAPMVVTKWCRKRLNWLATLQAEVLPAREFKMWIYYFYITPGMMSSYHVVVFCFFFFLSNISFGQYSILQSVCRNRLYGEWPALQLISGSRLVADDFKLFLLNYWRPIQEKLINSFGH